MSHRVRRLPNVHHQNYDYENFPPIYGKFGWEREILKSFLMTFPSRLGWSFRARIRDTPRAVLVNEIVALMVVLLVVKPIIYETIFPSPPIVTSQQLTYSHSHTHTHTAGRQFHGKAAIIDYLFLGSSVPTSWRYLNFPHSPDETARGNRIPN